MFILDITTIYYNKLISGLIIRIIFVFMWDVTVYIWIQLKCKLEGIRALQRLAPRYRYIMQRTLISDDVELVSLNIFLVIVLVQTVS